MREPHLVYYVEDTLPFQGPSGDTAIYNVKIANLGKKAAEEVVCILSFSTSTIQQSRTIIDPSIAYTESVLSNAYRVDLPSLNPQESTTLSVLATSGDKLPARPDISLRGNGIVGTQATKNTGNVSPWVPLTAGIGTAVAGSIAGLGTMLLMMRRRGLLPITPQDEGDQKYVLAYLCEIHSLSDDAERYRNMVPKVTYWSESDRLTTLALQSPKTEEAQKRKAVLKDLLQYGAVADESRGMIHYNIARIAKAEGKEEEFEEHITKAKKLSPKVVAKRLGLESIQKKK